MSSIPRSFLSDAHERLRDASRLWSFYAFTVLLAYGFAMFNLILVGDDWAELYNATLMDYEISVGRWMDDVIWHLTNDDSFAPPITICALSTAYLFFAAACCLCLGMKRRASYLIFACVLICFPFNIEAFAFKNLHLNWTFGIALATASGLLIVRGYEFLISGQRLKAAALGAAGAMAFSLSAATYQTLALFAPALVLVRVVGMLREPCAISKLFRSIALLCGFSAIVLGLGYLVYWETVWASSWLSSVPLKAYNATDEDVRYAIIGSFVDNWAELRRQIVGGLVLLRDLLFHKQHLFPVTIKLAFLAMTAALTVAVASDANQKHYPDQPRTAVARDATARAIILVGIVAVLFLMPLALGMVRKVSAYRYNNLAGVAIPYAMVFALLFDVLRDGRLRRALAVLIVGVVGIFIFEQNQASMTTFLLNRRDLAVTSSILDRITANPAFAPFAAKGRAAIVFYGKYLNIQLLPRPFSVDEFNFGAIDNCGVFNCNTGLIERASRLISVGGIYFSFSVWPNLPEDVAADEKTRLQQAIAQAHPWPAPDAVIFGADTIVVMLRTPYKLGETLRFSAGGNGLPYLASGWSDPEDWGIWSVGSQSDIALPLPPVGADIRLTVNADAFVYPARPHKEVRVFVNDVPLATWSFNDEEGARRRTVDIPKKLLQRSEQQSDLLRIRFVPSFAASLQQAGLGSGSRHLGMALLSMTLEAKPTEPVSASPNR